MNIKKALSMCLALLSVMSVAYVTFAEAIELTIQQDSGETFVRYAGVNQSRTGEDLDVFLFGSKQEMDDQELFPVESSDTRYWGCGIKAAQNFLRWFGIEKSQEDLFTRIETQEAYFTDELAVYPSKLRQGLEAVMTEYFDGIHVNRDSHDPDYVDYATIDGHLSKGMPVIILAEGGTHWVVAYAVRYNSTIGMREYWVHTNWAQDWLTEHEIDLYFDFEIPGTSHKSGTIIYVDIYDDQTFFQRRDLFDLDKDGVWDDEDNCFQHNPSQNLLWCIDDDGDGLCLENSTVELCRDERNVPFEWRGNIYIRDDGWVDSCPDAYNPSQNPRYWCRDDDKDEYCGTRDWFRWDCVDEREDSFDFFSAHFIEDNGTLDNCPDVYNPTQYDFDRDGLGAACDSNDLRIIGPIRF